MDQQLSLTTGALSLIVCLVVMTVVMSLTAPRVRGLIITHNGLWVACLGLVSTNLIEYSSASLKAWLTLSSGLICFNLAVWAVGFVMRNRAEPPHRSLNLPTQGLLTIKQVWGVLVVYLLAFSVYLVTIAKRFGLAALFTDPVTVRRATNPTYLEAIPLPARLLLYLAPLLLAVLLVKGGVKGHLSVFFRVPIILVLMGSMLMLLQRTNLITGIVITVAAYLVLITRHRSSSATDSRQPGNIRPRNPADWFKLTLGTAAIGVVGFATFQFIGKIFGKTRNIDTGDVVVSTVLRSSGLESIFTYFTSGIPAFLNLVDSTNYHWPPPGERVIIGDYNPMTYGTAFFELITSRIPGLETWNPVAPFIDIGILTNVYTWYEPFYRDFRQVGVIIGALALGSLIAYLWITAFESPIHFWIAVVVFATVLFSTFIPRLNSTIFAVIILSCWLLGRDYHQAKKKQALEG